MADVFAVANAKRAGRVRAVGRFSIELLARPVVQQALAIEKTHEDHVSKRPERPPFEAPLDTTYARAGSDVLRSADPVLPC